MHLRWMMATALPLLLLLQACVPVLVGGAAAGAGAAHDRRTLGAIIDDENIELKAAAKIGLDADLKKLAHVNMTSMNGMVLLTGEAATPEARDQILTHVRSVNGVRRITNELRIIERHPAKNQTGCFDDNRSRTHGVRAPRSQNVVE